MRVDALQEDYYNVTFDQEEIGEEDIRETVGYHLNNGFNVYSQGEIETAGTFVANSVLSVIGFYEEKDLNSRMEMGERRISDFDLNGNLSELESFLVSFSAFVNFLGHENKQQMNKTSKAYINSCNQLCENTDMESLEIYIEGVLEDE